MADKLDSTLDIGMSDVYIDTFKESQKSFDKYTNTLIKQNPSKKEEVDNVNNLKDQMFLDYGIALEKQKTISVSERRKIQEESDIRKINTINTYKDVKNPADLSRLIEKENDEGMKALEEIIGTDNLFKCLVLTTIGTASEIGKGMFDTLKIGEGTAEFTLIYENASATPEMRLEAMLKGVGVDALRAMAIIPGARSILQGFAKILNKIKIPVTSNAGGNLIGSEAGFIEIRTPKVKGNPKHNTKEIGAVGKETVKDIINPPYKSSFEKCSSPKELEELLGRLNKSLNIENVNLLFKEAKNPEEVMKIIDRFTDSFEGYFTSVVNLTEKLKILKTAEYSDFSIPSRELLKNIKESLLDNKTIQLLFTDRLIITDLYNDIVMALNTIIHV